VTTELEAALRLLTIRLDMRLSRLCAAQRTCMQDFHSGHVSEHPLTGPSRLASISYPSVFQSDCHHLDDISMTLVHMSALLRSEGRMEATKGRSEKTSIAFCADDFPYDRQTPRAEDNYNA
jgi:hypothetical protein